MAKKEEEVKKPTLKIEGEVLFKDVDPHVARLEFDRHKLLVSNRTFNIPAGAFPKDFDYESHKVSGKYKIELFIEKK